jgi:hypothetical protein
MLPELLRFSSANHLLEKIPEDLQKHHRAIANAVPETVICREAELAKSAKKPELWDGWTNGNFETGVFDPNDDDDDDDDEANHLLDELF